MKRKLLSILALLCLTVSSTWADVVASGSCGTSVNYSLDDAGVLTISGSGAMADYTMANDQPWMSYRNPSSGTKITSIVVEEGVTHIGNNAFMSCTNATSVSLPSSLTSIGDDAFRSCSNASLTSITIPDNVETIGTYAFAQTRLTTVTIGNSVTSIGDNAFYKCSLLATVTLNSNPAIGASAFPSGAAVTMNLTANSDGSAYWMTFYNQNYSFAPTDPTSTTIYKGALSGSSLTLTEVADIPKDNAAILKSTALPIVLTLDGSASADFTGNDLLGGTTVTAGYDAYTLSRGSAGTGTVGFYKFSGSLDGSKAHLEIAQSAGARGFIGFGDDGTTAIEAPTATIIVEDGEIYDLTGRRIEGQPTKKGIYVKNGQKFIVK